MDEIQARILVVDDDIRVRRAMARVIRMSGHTVSDAPSGEAALKRLADEVPDLILSDVHMGTMSGLELLRSVRETHPDLPFILVTGAGNMDMVVDALRHGATDFLVKPIDRSVMHHRVNQALSQRRDHLEVRRLRELVKTSTADSGIIGQHPTMDRLRKQIRRLAESRIPVFVHGETGTGKELVAQALHNASPASNGRLIPLNCAAIPSELMERELFGHVRGAFTGADANEPGVFVAAHGGTLFLDEIGDMPLDQQAKVLRVLETGEVTPLGSTTAKRVDVRLISATHRDLDQAVDERQFRSDLLFRLRVARIDVPPLRHRLSDIPLLAMHFLAMSKERYQTRPTALDPAAIRRLGDYHWPGNVRELQNVLLSAAAMSPGDVITADALSLSGDPSDETTFETPLCTLDELERRHIQRILAHAEGSKTRAAEILGIDRSTLWRKMRAFGG